MPRASAPPSSRSPGVRYRVDLSDPASHELAVTMTVPPLPDRGTVELVFPVWAPGSYMVRDFPRHLYDLVVCDARSRPLPVERVDKCRWRVASEGRGFTVRYRVFAFEQTVRTSHFDDSHAFWNGTNLFFLVEGESERPCEVEVRPPAGWRVSTGLPAIHGRKNSFRARDYDELGDSPFEVGTHKLLSFQARRTRFEVALYGRTNADETRLLGDLKKIVEATAELFGGFPFERYLFIIHALPSRGGGLEHAASTTLDIAGLSFEDERGYQSFAELAAHEFFHAWNVKRIHDRVLGPFDYTRENHTRLLWFHEGFTEYMESIILVRAGLVTAERYLKDLADDWPKYAARPGRNVSSLSDLSFEAWIKLYKPADNHTNRTASYYEKGKWAALVLEILMREATRGRRGVSDLFRKLWDDFGQPGVGLTERDVRAAVQAVAGRSLDEFFTRFIDGTEELPVPAALRRAGIAVEERTPWAGEDDPIKARRLRSWSGLTFAGSATSDRAQVRNVVPASPAWQAGLTYGDEIVAVDGVRVNGGNVLRRMADRGPGEAVEVAYFRQDLLRTTRLVLGESPERRWGFALAGAPSATARAMRRGWLGA